MKTFVRKNPSVGSLFVSHFTFKKKKGGRSVKRAVAEPRTERRRLLIETLNHRVKTSQELLRKNQKKISKTHEHLRLSAPLPLLLYVTASCLSMTPGREGDGSHGRRPVHHLSSCQALLRVAVRQVGGGGGGCVRGR